MPRGCALKKAGRLFLFSLLLLLALAGCSQDDGSSNSGNLELDYVGEESEEGIEKTADESGWFAKLREALTADRSTGHVKSSVDENSGKSSAPDSVQEIYEQGAAEYDAAQAESNGNSGGGAKPRQPDSRKTETGNKGGGENSNGKQPEQNNPIPSPAPAGDTVTMSINCHTATANGMHLDSKWAGIVPASGVILPASYFAIEDGDTVLDVLIRARDKYKLHMDYSGKASGAYVKGINNLYEFDGGRWSGWMYCVNGWYPNYGCGVYYLKAGDVIQWNYTCDLGLDLDAGMEGAQEWKDTHE